MRVERRGVFPLCRELQDDWHEMGFCAAGFEPAPASADDESMAIEIANILFGKFATLMADNIDGTIELSAPEVLTQSEQKFRHLIQSFQKAHDSNAVLKRYEFTRAGGTGFTVRLAYIVSKHGQS